MIAILQDGAYTDADGVYHRVLNAVVETPSGLNCSGVVSVFRNRVEIIGDGHLESAVILLHPVL